MYRVQKLLSKIGYCSRRSAEQLIESGKIKINDKIVSLGDKWYRGDIVKVNDKQIDLTLALQDYKVLYHCLVDELLYLAMPLYMHPSIQAEQK